jgi:thiosulfate/3-mercaptopyruvate sulfurtransferase
MMRFPLFFVALLLTLQVLAQTAGAEENELPSALVETTWLAENLQSVVVLDVRMDLASFTQTGHIPAARLILWKTIFPDNKTSDATSPPKPDARDNSPGKAKSSDSEKERVAGILRKSGVKPSDHLVITSQGLSSQQFAFAARLYWVLQSYGHQRISLLNGGNAKWLAEGRKRDAGFTEVAPLDYTFADPNGASQSTILITAAEIADSMGKEEIQLIDTRSLASYLGLEQSSFVKVPGHIPQSKLLPASFLTTNSKGAILRTKDELLAIIEALRIPTNRPLVVYSDRAISASLAWFVLNEHLNIRTRLYNGSMQEWANGLGRPVLKMHLELQE